MWLGSLAYAPQWSALALAIGAGAILQVIVEVGAYLMRSSSKGTQAIFSVAGDGRADRGCRFHVRYGGTGQNLGPPMFDERIFGVPWSVLVVFALAVAAVYFVVDMGAGTTGIR